MPLLYEKDGAVALLTLSRPHARNAWGEDYNEGLKELLPRLEDDPEVRCVILTGDDKGGAFSAGADLKNPKTHSSDPIAEAIESLPKRRRHQAMNLIACLKLTNSAASCFVMFLILQTYFQRLSGT